MIKVASICNNNYRQLKIICIPVLIVYVVGLISAWLNPATGYEASIYLETHAIFWISLILCYILSISLILVNTFSHVRSRLIYVIGVFFGVLGSISLYSIILIRGYFAINVDGDTGTHIGLLSSVISSGTVPPTYSAYYPALFSESAIYQILTNIDVISVVNYLPSVYFFLFIIGTYLFARSLLPDSRMVNICLLSLLILPFGSAPFIGLYTHYFAPGVLSNKFVPLVLFMIVMMNKSKTLSYRYLAVAAISSIALVFYHPVQTIEVLLFLLVVLGFIFINKNNKIITSFSFRKSTLLFIVISLMFFLWTWNFFGYKIVDMFLSLFSILDVSDRGVSSLVNNLEAGSSYSLSIFDYIKAGAINLVYYLFIPLSVVIAVVKKVRKSELICLIFGYISILAFFTLMMAISSSSFGFMRLAGMIYMCAIVLSGYVVVHIFTSLKKRVPSISYSLAPFIILIMLISIFMFYPSPITLHQTYQTTETEVVGSETLLPYLNLEHNLTGIHYLKPGRYIHLISGYRGVISTNYYDNPILINTGIKDNDIFIQVPHNFNYNLHTTLGESYTSSTYLFLMQRDKEAYVEYFQKVEDKMWSRVDFRHLEFDDTTSRVYDNKEFNLYFINTHRL